MMVLSKDSDVWCVFTALRFEAATQKEPLFWGGRGALKTTIPEKEKTTIKDRAALDKDVVKKV